MNVEPDPDVRTLLAAAVLLDPLILDGGLAVVPIVAAAAAADADLLEEARAEVTEVTDAGVVNLIRVKNAGTKLLLLLDGEEVIGAKQNRIFNASFLVPPGAPIDLPVSCVEKGRWRARSQAFQASSRTVTQSVRAGKLRRVTASAMASEASSYDADQRAVWAEVDDHLRKSRVASHTSAYADAADAQAEAIEERLAVLAPRPGQIGFVAVQRDRLLTLELLGSPALYGRAWRKLARGLLAEPPDAEGASPHAAQIAARALEALRSAPFVRKPAPGCGTSAHAVTAEIVAGAIAHDGNVFHLLATAP
jgi:ARG/rhodanese/phosphatase superfamily protein